MLAAWEQRILSGQSDNPLYLRSSHLVAFSLQQWPPYVSETFSEQSLNLSVFKDIYFAESRGAQKHQSPDNLGVYAALALLHAPRLNIGSSVQIGIDKSRDYWGPQWQFLSHHRALIIMLSL